MLKLSEYMTLPKTKRQSHIDLSLPCIERGGGSTNHRGVLAEFLNSEIPSGSKILLCHACHNSKCSNPRHLYWGTPKENTEDAIQNGTHLSFYQNVIRKNGRAVVKKRNSELGKMLNEKLQINAYSHLKKPKSEEHKAKIAQAIRSKHLNGDYTNSKLGRKKRV